MLSNRLRPKEDQHQNHTSQAPSSGSIPRPSMPALNSVKSNSAWTGDYLKDLRTNRPARPTGARPLPARNESKSSRASLNIIERATSAMGMYAPAMTNTQDVPERSTSAMSHRQSLTARETRERIGSPVARQPMSKMRNVSGGSRDTTTTTRTGQSSISKTSNASNGSNGQPYKIPYYERGQRWMEKQEMSSLRHALEEKDLTEEQKVHESAQDEAAILVWKHQNPEVPYPYPEKLDFRSHLKKGSHARTLSNTPYETLYVCKGGVAGPRSASDGSNGSQRSASDGSQKSTGSKSGRFSSLSFSMRSNRVFGSTGSKRNRVTSRQNQNNIFPNPKDKIYEAEEDVFQTTQDDAKPLPLKIKPRNTSYGNQSIKDQISNIEGNIEHSMPIKDVSIVEIYKNSPSQSRNAHYRVNKGLPSIPTRSIESSSDGQAQTRDGKEIRAGDIRQATSMTLKDRSSKLPMPTIVSDRPGRPIVSFQKDYKPRQKELQHETAIRGSSLDINRNQEDTDIGPFPILATPSISLLDTTTPQPNDLPSIPSITLPDAPTIQISHSASVPTISFPDEQANSDSPTTMPTISIDSFQAPSISITPSVPVISAPTSSSRPLPQPSKRSSPFARSLPPHGASGVSRSAPHWSPAIPRGTAQCAACALPIAGKIVSASSKRFHPSCFTCFCCGELLECVAFYPEPEKFRAERLDRIQARLDGSKIPQEQANFTEEDDGDDGLRFYCHLDFHEKFSPRCKSCKTPIEGQVIVACGAEWHVGHFFCAECGDPFEADMPFVEKDGFAWCVNCHTKRYSGKCAGCRKPITDLVVSALGKEWHGQCFRCKECGDDFDDGRFFTRGEDEIPVCVKCEERRLKA